MVCVPAEHRFQKETERRPIVGVRHEITALFSTALLPMLGVACGSGDVVLGIRGAIDGEAGAGSLPNGAAGMAVAAGGFGGSIDVAGQSAGLAGRAGQASGSGGHPAMMVTGGTAAPMGVAGSGAAPQSSPGCGMTPRITDASLQNITVTGVAGDYIVELPTGYDKTRAYPLITSFRGAGVSADSFRTYLNLHSAVGADAIVVTPDCLGSAAAWDITRDLPLFDAVLQQVEANYCVDPRKVFAAGHTSGGYFVNALATIRGAELRGIAPLTVGPPAAAGQGEFAVWMSQGNMDTTVPVTSGRADRDFWAKQNKCDTTMPTAVDPTPCVEYAKCDAGFPVRYCEYDGTLDLPVFAASGIWEFFKAL
jgi:polyhydroxybutyrate depolymerase